MPKKVKKVILFIVEGPTEETSLSPICKKIFQREDVRFHVVHGDITTAQEIGSTNAVTEVTKHICLEMERYGFRRSDILKIIHIIDTDGSFIPDSCVKLGTEQKIHYEATEIRTSNPQTIRNRNHKKSSVIQRLYSTNKIGTIPYKIYYFSRNMEHVLHNISIALSDDKKTEYADLFADKYTNNTEDFIHFLTYSEFSTPGSYLESWKYIFSGLNSLQRHSNIHLLFS
ncbi:MAG: hypothetical protein ACK5MN_10270 [Lachnospiraceae bacterium]